MSIYRFLITAPHIDCGFCCSSLHLLSEVPDPNLQPTDQEKENNPDTTPIDPQDSALPSATPADKEQTKGLYKCPGSGYFI